MQFLAKEEGLKILLKIVSKSYYERASSNVYISSLILMYQLEIDSDDLTSKSSDQFSFEPLIAKREEEIN